ncbi:M24 family metallopeptidase [Desulfovermiculus halophilus]|uniref:M24 family metallopeptidase n=1 Tax=Desulfovermiculus halophilus TaxID=339722 RepID=UPI00047F5332|nr:Xaa-Pro peptidase family protein [Desulfovermiculus halophilus]
MPDIYEQRREKLRAKLVEQGLDAYLVLHPANRYYLSGFELHDPQCNESAGALVVAADGKDRLCTDPRYLDAARRLWPEEDIFIYRNKRTPALAEFLGKQPYARIGFETRIMSHELFAALNTKLDLIPHVGLTEELRTVKDEVELEHMRASCTLNHHVFSSLPSWLEPGRTEQELAWRIERCFRENGASELAFSPIVAVNQNAALPHSIPGPDQLSSDCLLLVDVGGRCQEYCSDQTRTFWAGSKPSDRFQRTLDLVQGAQHKAISAVRPGMEIKDLYQTAWAYFDQHGVAEYFTHALGHGIGLETHEYPGLGPKAQGVLLPGMVITIEPGLYYPEWGGIRWEHMVVVTEDGAEVL